MESYTTLNNGYQLRCVIVIFFINKTGKLLEELNNSSDMLLEENNQIQDGNRKPVFHLAYFCFLFIWGYFFKTPTSGSL